MAALSHVKTSPVGDFTGTVTYFNSQGSTTTGAATDLVRPSDWNSVHNFFQTISGNTAGQSTASGTNLVLGFTNEIQGSLSTAAGAATLWIGEPPVSRSGYNPYADVPLVAGQMGQGTLQFDPEEIPTVQFDRLLFPVNYTGASNSTATMSASLWFGFYTRNDSTLSLLTSTSTSTTLGHSGTVGSWSLHSGMRLLSIPMTTTLTDGLYWAGVVSRTSTSSANVSFSNIMGSNLNSNFVGLFGASHATTIQFTLGQGVYSATTSAMPASVAFTQIRGSDSAGLRPPVFMMVSGTV